MRQSALVQGRVVVGPEVVEDGDLVPLQGQPQRCFRIVIGAIGGGVACAVTGSRCREEQLDSVEGSPVHTLAMSRVATERQPLSSVCKRDTPMQQMCRAASML